jgi:hypothetical protein
VGIDRFYTGAVLDAPGVEGSGRRHALASQYGEALLRV